MKQNVFFVSGIDTDIGKVMPRPIWHIFGTNKDVVLLLKNSYRLEIRKVIRRILSCIVV